MKSENKKVMTRDIQTKGEDMVQTYNFPKYGFSVEASSLSEAQAKAEAKNKALNK